MESGLVFSWWLSKGRGTAGAFIIHTAALNLWKKWMESGLIWISSLLWFSLFLFQAGTNITFETFNSLCVYIFLFQTSTEATSLHVSLLNLPAAFVSKGQILRNDFLKSWIGHFTEMIPDKAAGEINMKYQSLLQVFVFEAGWMFFSAAPPPQVCLDAAVSQPDRHKQEFTSKHTHTHTHTEQHVHSAENI